MPKTGKQQYNKYLVAAAPALGRCGATIAFHSDIIVDSNGSRQQQWDSLLIGSNPDKCTLLQGVADSANLEAFKIRERALSDAMLLATLPIDPSVYDASVPRSGL